MSLCLVRWKGSRKGVCADSLPGKSIRKTSGSNGTPLTSWRGSLTLESVVIIPLVAICLTTILFMFRVMQVQGEMQQALFYAGRRGAVEAAAGKSKLIPLTAAEIHFRKKIKEADAIQTYVKKGGKGVSLLGSEVKDNYLILKASCQISFPFKIFGLKDVRILTGCKSRLWNGHTQGEEKDSYVYYTAKGKVYHKSLGCPSLDLTTHGVNYDQLGGLRNKDGHKYYPCSSCGAKKGKNSLIFITDYGTAYHTSLNCSKLKRTIKKIRLSKVKGRRPCKICAGARYR